MRAAKDLFARACLGIEWIIIERSTTVNTLFKMLRDILYVIAILFRKHVQTRRCAYTRKKCTSFLTRARGAEPFARACLSIALINTERVTTVNTFFEMLRTNLYGIAILFGKKVQTRRCAHARKKCTSFLTRARGEGPFCTSLFGHRMDHYRTFDDSKHVV